MKYTDRKEFLYDPAWGSRRDTQVALKIQAGYIRKHSPNPPPKFFEVNRDNNTIDDVWHVPLAPRTNFSRTLDIPAINTFDKPSWTLTKLGYVAQRKDKFWVSNLELQLFNYFPTRGDMVAWNGYRYIILNAAPDPTQYWGQTGVWLGLCCECIIPPIGDARPVVDANTLVPAEINGPKLAPAPHPDPTVILPQRNDGRMPEPKI